MNGRPGPGEGPGTICERIMNPGEGAPSVSVETVEDFEYLFFGVSTLAPFLSVVGFVIE